MIKVDRKIIMLILVTAIIAGCISQKPPETTTSTTTTTTTTSTTKTTTTTSTTTTTTSTTTTSFAPVITTTTTTTSTTVLYSTTTTIANAVCYLNSDCGEQRVTFACRIKNVVSESQPYPEITENGTQRYLVHKITYSPICLDPGTAIARCEEKRSEVLWDECQGGETCIDNCHTCVPEGEKSCPN